MLYAIPEQPVAEGDFVMAAIVGGVLTGAGIGLVFATGYSTGGTDLLGEPDLHVLSAYLCGKRVVCH